MFVSLTCAFVYERYDFDLEIFENILYERSAQVYPALPDDPSRVRTPAGTHTAHSARPPHGSHRREHLRSDG